MNNQQAYNSWSDTYDTVENKTRDVEAKALRESISGGKLQVLEIGCGTGKNTEFLQTVADKLISVDFSVEMIERAKLKINAEHVEFRQMDLRGEWNFAENSTDLAVCSLVLEHIENIDDIFQNIKKVLKNDGRLYIGELHPFKQYQGSKAKFETPSGIFELECFVHHVSDYFSAGTKNGFTCIELKEWFDNDDKTRMPRILTMIFQKN